MTDLNEYECEMLDTVLEAFGVPDNLTRAQILQLFDNDEATAYAMVQALIREQLVKVAGKAGPYEIPEKLILKPKGEKFLKEGGFTKRYQLEQEKANQVGGTLAKLQQQNLRLQNEKIGLQTDLANLRKTLKKQQIGIYSLTALFVAALIWLLVKALAG